ncbi:hypothetical protein ABFB50_00965 [Dehalococcoides sp. THU3]|uniref:hypothetical protein n=1 Tax=Dehalococcoides TaxID=61434 RepID=UPI003218206C
MYEPTLKLTRQILEELQESRGTQAECGEVTPGNTLFKDTIIFVRLPTIKKALELYENRPQWQDKPDKEGWWWIKSSSKKLGIWIVEILEKDGTLLIPKYISMIGGTKSYLYIPEPEPYKGEE